MQIRINGRIGKQEILEQLASVLNYLEDAGVSDFMGFDLNIDTYSQGEKVIPLVNGKRLNVVLNDHKNHICIVPPNLMQKKEIDGGHVSLNKKALLQGVVNLHTEGEIVKKELDKNREEVEQRCRTTEEFANKLLAVRKAKVNERLQSTRCIEQLRDQLNLSHEEFKGQVSNTGWITTKKGIQSYTDEDIGNKVFRISMKVAGSDEKKIYLFNEEAQLKFESEINYNYI